MPSVSQAQRRKMAALHSRGEITDKQWEDFKVVKPNRRKKVGKKRK